VDELVRHQFEPVAKTTPYTAGMSDHSIQFETKSCVWALQITREGKSTVATVTSRAPGNSASGSSIASPPAGFSITETDQADLMARVKEEIQRRDGAILRTLD
jgi:hypothetical protein